MAELWWFRSISAHGMTPDGVQRGEARALRAGEGQFVVERAGSGRLE